jgi:phosphoglycerate dehydrogenase-like enzyme
MNREIFVLDSAVVPHADDASIEIEALQDCGSVTLLHLPPGTTRGTFSERADAIIVWHQVDLKAAAIQGLARARIIVRNGVGFEGVDLEAAAACGIPVANVPDYGTEEVADHAMMLCLALSRRLREANRSAADGRWRYQDAEGCRRIRGQVFGIVGCGRIGTAVALRAKAFGYDVRFHDPYVGSGYEKAIGAARVRSLQELLAEADVVSVHAPLTPETRHMISDRELRSMKPGALLINTARGPILRYESVCRALENGWIAGAGLDVLEHEPDGVSALHRHPNCIVTPHSAFYSAESLVEMRRTAAVLVREALLGGTLRNVVNGVCSLPAALAGQRV